MDIPVVLIKLRDYLLWFGPAYLAAISLGAAAEVALLRLFPFPAPDEETQGEGADGANAPTVKRKLERNLLLSIWLRVTGRSTSTQEIPLQLYLWASVTAQSLSWLALLVMAQISWALALLRLGYTLILASLIATLVPLFVSDRPTANLQSAISPEGSQALLPHIEWWRAFQKRFSESSNEVVLAAGLGALLFGLAPEFYSVLRAALAAPFSYISGAAIGILTPFVPGTEAPLVAALQTKGVGPGAIISLMLAISATPWGLLRDMKRRFGPRTLAIYLVAALLLAALLGALAEPILIAVGVV